MYVTRIMRWAGYIACTRPTRNYIKFSLITWREQTGCMWKDNIKIDLKEISERALNINMWLMTGTGGKFL